MDGIFGIHNWPTMPIGRVGARAGTLMAGSAEFSVTIVGRGGHAALPQGNIDPIIPTAALVTAFQARARASPLAPMPRRCCTLLLLVTTARW